MIISLKLLTDLVLSDSTLVRSVAEFGILVGRCDSFLGRNTLLCCLHFGWQFDDFVYGNVDLSNGTLLSKHHGLANSCHWHTMQFLSEIISIRDGVFNLQFSDGLTLSWHELNAIVLYLATDRQT